MVTNTNDILIFDRGLLRQRSARNSNQKTEQNFLADWADEQLKDRLQDIKRDFKHRLHIGPAEDFSLNFGPAYPEQKIIADPEFFPTKPGALDLITTCLNLHRINDLPGTLLQIKQALKPDGLFMAAMFGGETLHELRESLTQTEIHLKGGISPRVFPFADKQQMGALLQRAGFALPVVDSEIVTVTYDSLTKLLHDLRHMGEGNIIRNRNKANPGKTFFAETEKYYRQNFTDENDRIRARFEIIFLIGWVPHKSQQQPLRPGSAKTRLAEALNTNEVKI